MQVNMLEAKNRLSNLVMLLETHQEDTVLIARNGIPVAQMTRIPRKPKKRIGVASGKFHVPDNFDAWDKEIEDMFGGKLE
ncbi:MAG: type II toxin-antitoxin system Phd/YefM family antitoxin [Selenomonadaceae bacterium]